MVGLGSNLLVRDGGLRGTVIFTHWALREIRLDASAGGAAIYAEAGVASPKVARFAAMHDLARRRIPRRHSRAPSAARSR